MKTASAAMIKQTVRTEMVTTMTANVVREKIPLRIWLRMSNKAVTQRRLNKRIIALPARYGRAVSRVSIVTSAYHYRCPQDVSVTPIPNLF